MSCPYFFPYVFWYFRMSFYFGTFVHALEGGCLINEWRNARKFCDQKWQNVIKGMVGYLIAHYMVRYLLVEESFHAILAGIKYSINKLNECLMFYSKYIRIIYQLTFIYTSMRLL